MKFAISFIFLLLTGCVAYPYQSYDSGYYSGYNRQPQVVIQPRFAYPYDNNYGHHEHREHHHGHHGGYRPYFYQ